LQDEYQNNRSLLLLFCKKNPTLQSQEDYLPEASRFAQLEELDWAFGTWERKIKGNIWQLYTLRISDFIVECVDANLASADMLNV
jgi:hypothetical protein